jgi:hypothetical protein
MSTDQVAINRACELNDLAWASPSSLPDTYWECRGRSPLPGFGAAHLGDAIAGTRKLLFLFSPPEAPGQRARKEDDSPFKKKVSRRKRQITRDQTP